MNTKILWLTFLWIVALPNRNSNIALAEPAGPPGFFAPQSTSALPVPPGSTFNPPSPNACESNYDQFYETEPGVYTYWALCELGAPLQIYDYVGQYDFTTANHVFGAGGVTGGAGGPVPDGETAASVAAATSGVGNQGLPVNTNQGTISAWISGDGPNYPVPAVLIQAVLGKSAVAIKVSNNGGVCFTGAYVNSVGTPSTVQKCGYTANTWHRVSFTWSNGTLGLYIDGASVATGSSAGLLDNKIFFYKLFPGCCQSSTKMTLAKVSVSNQAWTTAQVAADVALQLPTVPVGGVFVGSQELGTIHKDVLGFAGMNPATADPAARSAVVAGLKTAGVTSLRYAEGQGGIDADLQDWQSRGACTKKPGVMGKVANTSTTSPSPDNYLQGVAQPLKLDVVYTVNYGTNPPVCNAGGDPFVNGSSLVHYVNQTKQYGIKYFEIGNEVFSNYTEADFHPSPNTGQSYVQYEPAFYTSMKAEDPTIKIGVPVSLSIYAYQNGFTLPVLAGASYDAVIFHNYPVSDPITDGATLYQDRVASKLGRIRGELLAVQTALLNAGKPPDAIWVTEWDSEQGGGMWSKQTIGAVAPLFATTQLAEYMLAGVQLATWFAQGGLNVCSTVNYDSQGDSSYSWWKCGNPSLVYSGPLPNVGELAVGLHPGDLFPAGRAFQILSESGFVTEGEHMLRTQTDVQKAPWILSYGATHGSSYALILINRDRDITRTVPVAFANKFSGKSVQQWTYGRAQYDLTKSGNWSAAPVQTTLGAWNSEFMATLPPWSVNVFIFDN